MNLSAYIAKDLNRVDFRARNKKQALARIAEIACTSPLFKNETPERIAQLLAEREEVVSTGIGKGVAIPHARLDGIDDFIIFALIAPDGVEFDAVDGRRVTVIFVIFAPSGKVNEHLKVLANIANTLSRGNVKKELLKIRNEAVLYEVLIRSFSGGNIASPSENQRKRLMILVLYYEEFLNDILEYLIEVNVDGATITKSEGMGAHISTIPLFASFLGFMRENQNISHTIMALIPQDNQEAIVQGIEAITGDLEKTRGAMIIIQDVAFLKGTMNML